MKINTFKKSLVLLGMLFGCSLAGLQTYTIEDINDPGFSNYPPPPPVNVRTHSFIASAPNHHESITVNSLHIRNLSITIENTGQGSIQSAYLFGPHGYDFRRQDSIVAQISRGAATQEEKFYRVHEWEGIHLMRGELLYNDPDASQPLYYLNALGMVTCSEHASTVHSLLHYIPPLRSVWGRRIGLTGHGTGEVTFNNGQTFMAYDASPHIRWVYYDYDNRSPVSWDQIENDLGLATRVQSVTGWEISETLPIKTKRFVGLALGPNSQDFDYDLRPNESITLHFDMRGRIDKTNTDWLPQFDRNPCDYASGVYAYKPDFSGPQYKAHVFEEQNITLTANGLVPTDPNQNAFVIFHMKSYPWHLVGGNIKAFFKTAGKVYVTSNPILNNYTFPENPLWKELSASTKEYGATHSIEGRCAFWVKFEFTGAGSGLDSAEIKSEMRMSPLSLPGLEYGTNRIRFTAEDMGGSSAKITYTYDDQSPFFNYQKATSNYGRHIRFRVGGVLEVTRVKSVFWEKLKNDPNGTEHVTVNIHQMTGTGSTFGPKVRTLFAGNLKWGLYKMYWDGRRDNGSPCPANEMYCYKINGSDGDISDLNERLYLFPKIWPVPNEMMDSSTTIVEISHKSPTELRESIHISPHYSHTGLNLGIKGLERGEYRLSLYNIEGKKILEYAGQNIWAGDAYKVTKKYLGSSGIYFVRLNQHNRNTVSRFIILP